MPGSPLHVWVLSDNRPGHYNQSHGIVTALAGLRPIEQHWLNIDLRLGLARNPMRLLLNHLATPPPVSWLGLFYAMPALPQAPCDLVVSTGGRTSFANAWLARRMQARNIFAGSLRRLSPALFDLVLTLEPIRPAAPNNLVLDLPPSAVDVSQLHRDGLALRTEQGLNGQAVWTIMLGGDGAGYRYRDQDWRQLAQLLERDLRQGFMPLELHGRQHGLCGHRGERAIGRIGGKCAAYGRHSNGVPQELHGPTAFLARTAERFIISIIDARLLLIVLHRLISVSLLFRPLEWCSNP